MRPALRFVLALIVGLGLLTWGSSTLVSQTTWAWFEKDLTLRSRLAVTGARQPLLDHWRDRAGVPLRGILGEMARDERIMGAAACDSDATPLAHTPGYPEAVTCAEAAPHVRDSAADDPGRWRTWASILPHRGGSVHLTAIPVVDGSVAQGFVLLAHDMSYIERREATARKFVFIAFAFLAVAGSLTTMLVARLSWRGWSNELRRLLSGEAPAPEFRPFVRDVRDLVERLAAEREADGDGGLWTPNRLKSTLSRHLHGERIVIVANREPYIHEKQDDGSVKVVHPASGLVTALEPVMRACSGVWVAHGSGTADREASDAKSRVKVPPGEESYSIRRLWLTPEEERGYYYGFSNEGLWPLSHLAHTRPIFRGDDFRHYTSVNEKFAGAVCDEVDTDDPIILVQDYHFALLPRMLRERLPRATVLTFWHIPWPNAERFGICPWRDEVIKGLLGSSIVGFHTQSHCNNFIYSVDRFIEARIDRERNAIVHRGHTTLVRPYPISIDWPNKWAKGAPPVEECRRDVVKELGLRENSLIGVGVDRLDYTKGIEERLLAVERLLERNPEFRGRFTFIQLAAPSRTAIPQYKHTNDSVEALAARINDRFSTNDYRPIILFRSHHEPPAVFRYYRAADLCYVSSLHDGMNLVAKEFVAARDDERGVLLLSHFAGASMELTEALIVNPYDIDEASEAMATALTMSAEEQRDRMRAMRAFVAEFNVYRWAGRMLVDAARLRRRERLTGRLSRWLTGSEAS